MRAFRIVIILLKFNLIIETRLYKQILLFKNYNFIFIL